MSRIVHKEFVPTIQDVLIIRKPTVGVQEHAFHVNGLDFRYVETFSHGSLTLTCTDLCQSQTIINVGKGFHGFTHIKMH